MVERGISPRSPSHPKHNAHTSDLPHCVPARPQLVWSVDRATLTDALLLSDSPRLALGAPLGSGSAPGVSGCLRVALRTRLSELSAGFGLGSERCRVLNDVCVCRSRGDAPPRGTGMRPVSRPMM